MNRKKQCALLLGLLVMLAWVGVAPLNQASATQSAATHKGVTTHRNERSEQPSSPERRRPRAGAPLRPVHVVQSGGGRRSRTRAQEEKPVVAPTQSDTILWYAFGGSGTQSPGENRRLERSGSWSAWAEDAIEELPEGCTRVWLHNPFGLYVKRNGDRRMWIDQWVLAQGVMEDEFTDIDAFVQAIQMLRDAGVTEIITYVGSPLTLDVEDRNYEHVETLLRPMLEAGCSLAFDATYDWHKGDETDVLIQELRGRGHRVYVEPWLFADREYGEIDGVVHADRFFPRNSLREAMRRQPIVEKLDCERVVLQRIYTAEELTAMRLNGATIAFRPWTQTGQTLAADAADATVAGVETDTD